jgi:hypothetical protein
MRMSSILRRCREMNFVKDVESELRRVWAENESCPVHGKLEDPIVGITKDSIAIACPFCSGEDVLKAYEEEGKRALA